jgi:hypothetical protein
MTINVLNLFTAETVDKILSRGLAVAKALGLPVTSWRSGDPTKSLYHFAAEHFGAQEERNTEWAKSSFMSTAEGDWATVHAKEMYGVDRGGASYAAPTITLRNAGGGVFDLGIGDLVVKCTATGKTFTNTDNPGVLGPGAVLTYALAADEAGAASSVGDNELDDVVTPANALTFGVVIDGSTSAAAQDEQSVEELRDQCGDTLGALSPNGPPDAYEYVCKNPKLTGNTEINRASTQGDSDTGEVTVYVASAAGSVSAPSVAAAQQAVYRWATPWTVRPTVVSAAPVSVNIVAQIAGDGIPASFQTAINGELGKLFVGLPIGATVYRSRIIAAIHAAVPQIASVNLIAPATDTILAAYAVPTLGTLNITEVAL